MATFNRNKQAVRCSSGKPVRRDSNVIYRNKQGSPWIKRLGNNLRSMDLGTALNKTFNHAKINYFDNSNSKLKLYKIQNVTVMENPELENEDVAEDIAKAIEEAYGFSCYFNSLPYIKFIPFFDFLQVIFLAVTFSTGPYNKLLVSFINPCALPILRERDEVIK